MASDRIRFAHGVEGVEALGASTVSDLLAPERLATYDRARELRGRFVFDREPRRTHPLPFTRESAEDREALWKLCERLVDRVG